MKITESHREALSRDGVVILKGAFSPEWLDKAGEGIELSLENPGPMFIEYTSEGSEGRYCTDYWIWRDNAPFREFVFDSPAPEIAGELLDAKSITLLTDNWMLRDQGAANRAPWHHDEPYFDFEGNWCVMWIPLEAVPAGEGMAFIRGSHKWEGLITPLNFTTHQPKEGVRPQEFRPVPSMEAVEARDDILQADLDAGDCVLFHSKTVHGALSAGQSHHRIRRLTLRFGAEGVTYRRRGPWTKNTADVLEGEGLRDGNPITCDLLPVIWRREEENARPQRTDVHPARV